VKRVAVEKEAVAGVSLRRRDQKKFVVPIAQPAGATLKEVAKPKTAPTPPPKAKTTTTTTNKRPKK
jgi:hypothetical protein